jgi:hypothetical protein
LQQFIRQGTDQSKIYDIFCKLSMEQLTNPATEVVKVRQQKTAKNMGSSIYSKKGWGRSDSIAKYARVTTGANEEISEAARTTPAYTVERTRQAETSAFLGRAAPRA